MEDQETNIYGKTPTPSETTPQQLPLPPKPITPFTLIKRVIFTILGIICLLGVWETFFPTKPPAQNQSTVQLPSHEVTWKTYTNTNLHYTIKYPDSLEMSQETTYSTAFQVKQQEQIGFPTLYVSVIPDGYTNTNNIYNFMPADIINSFFTMKNDQTQVIQPGQDPQYWTYQKIATIPLAGKNAIVIQNNNVWQATNGEINRRILIKANNFTYIIGSYYNNQQELNEYHDFLYSFTLLP